MEITISITVMQIATGLGVALCLAIPFISWYMIQKRRKNVLAEEKEKYLRYETLRLKGMGGVPLTDEEQRFMKENRNVKRPASTYKEHKQQQVKLWTRIKNKIAEKTNPYNPNWYKAKIELLEKEKEKVEKWKNDYQSRYYTADSRATELKKIVEKIPPAVIDKYVNPPKEEPKKNGNPDPDSYLKQKLATYSQFA